MHRLCARHFTISVSEIKTQHFQPIGPPVWPKHLPAAFRMPKLAASFAIELFWLALEGITASWQQVLIVFMTNTIDNRRLCTGKAPLKRAFGACLWSGIFDAALPLPRRFDVLGVLMSAL
jgi:hypothetical protein